MSAPAAPFAATLAAHALTRRTMLKTGALTVGFALAGLQTRAEGTTPGPRTLDPNQLDSFLAVDGDGTVTFAARSTLGKAFALPCARSRVRSSGLASTRSNMSKAIPRSRRTRGGRPDRTVFSTAACRSGAPPRPHARRW